MIDNKLEFKSLSKNFAILYVEDDQKISLKMKTILETLFERCDIAFDGLMGLEVYKAFAQKENRFYDIVISDIVMPKMDGVAFCRELLKLNKSQEIIVISAYGNKQELIELINMGIKKFIEKPFSSGEMIKKLENSMRKISKHKENPEMTITEELTWNKKLQKLFYKNNEIDLTYKEGLILEALILYPNKIFSNFDLFAILSEDEYSDKEFSNETIKTIIKRIRKKLPFNIIKNIYGLGYKLQLQ